MSGTGIAGIPVYIGTWAFDARQGYAREVSSSPHDSLGRPLHDLRISVTDRCNFRCPFCMPKEITHRFLPRSEVLSYEEITRLATLFASLGVRKIRLTGGEPLLRNDIEVLVEMLGALERFDDLALTTNGWLLAERATSLVRAGLGRVTVSLHSLDPRLFGELSGLGLELERVLDGIRTAIAVGLGPVKLNTVVIRDRNDHEILDLARFGRDHGATVRFIEFMDVGTLNRWDPSSVVSAKEIVERVDARFPLEPVAAARPGEVARRFRYRDGAGEIGVIASVTQPFCGDCDRARLSARGELMLCLFAAVGHDLKGPLRSGASDEDLRERIASIWSARTDRYSEERADKLRNGSFVPAPKVEMFRIGG